MLRSLSSRKFSRSNWRLFDWNSKEGCVAFFYASKVTTVFLGMAIYRWIREIAIHLDDRISSPRPTKLELSSGQVVLGPNCFISALLKNFREIGNFFRVSEHFSGVFEKFLATLRGCLPVLIFSVISCQKQLRISFVMWKKRTWVMLRKNVLLLLLI